MFKLTRFLLPLVFFSLLILLFWRSLGHDPHELSSTLIGHNVPSFQLPSLYSEQNKVSTQSFNDQVTLLNVWASWCSACALEHEALMRLHQMAGLRIVGLNYKDDPKAGQAWLKRLGNPYDQVAVDHDGQVAIEFGVYGTPETFVIDKNGIIRYRQVGPIDAKALKENILPLISELNKK